jgi:hypothetical protein
LLDLDPDQDPLETSKSTRGKFEILISDFRTEYDKPKSNVLTRIGFYEEYLTAVIDSNLVISYNPNRILNHYPYSIVGNYVGVYFGDNLITQNQVVFDFIRELSALLHIEKVTIHTRLNLQEIEIEEYPYEQIDLDQLKVRRRRAYRASRQLDDIEDLVKHYDTNIIMTLTEDNTVFSNEERRVYTSMR